MIVQESTKYILFSISKWSTFRKNLVCRGMSTKACRDAVIGEELQYAVLVIKDEPLVGHLPRIVRLYTFCEVIHCDVPGRRYSADLANTQQYPSPLLSMSLLKNN